MTNVVLVTVDCLRADRVLGHQRNTTPTLNKISTESLVFESAYSTGPYTTESVPGIITGQHSYNGTHYGSNVTWKAISETPTLASWFQDQGYQTFATLTNPHLSRERNFNLGFDQFKNLRLGEPNGNTTEEEGENDSGFQLGTILYDFRSRMRNYDSLINPYTLPVIAYRYFQTLGEWPTVSGEEVIDNFKQDVKELDNDLFSWVHLMDLHAPLRPSTVRSGGLSAATSTYNQLKSDTARAARIHEPRYDTMYDSALRYVDDRISDLIDHLKSIGEWDETVLIVTGDHGEVLFDRDEIYGHPQHHLYDDLLHVPLIVRTPDDRNGRIDAPISLAWLHELIAELCDLEPGDFPTKSNRQSLLDEETDGNLVISDTITQRGHTVAVRDGEQKVLHHKPAEDTVEIEYEYGSRDIQFAYREDPRERIDQKKDISPKLSEAASDLETDPDDVPTLGGGFSRDVEDRLADLGYKM